MSKKDVGYFPHDTNARNDERILELRASHGAAGYAWFFMLCEIMAETPEGSLDLSRLGGYSLSLGITKPELSTFIKELLSLGLLFEIKEGALSSKRMQEHKETRRGMSEGGRNRWKKATPVAPPVVSPVNSANGHQETAASSEETPEAYLKRLAPIRLNTLEMLLNNDVKKTGEKWGEIVRLWSQALVASDKQLSNNETARINQLEASLRKYVENWASRVIKENKPRELERSLKG